MDWLKWSLVLLTSAYVGLAEKDRTSTNRSFVIGYNNNCFLKDGECFRYVSGSMHYFRVPRPYWKDRMLKMRAAGLNALQTYIEWSSHEPEPGQFQFSGNLDLVDYIQMAADTGFLVILRPGPFIDSERDMGGLPYWLLRMNSSMVLRTLDSTYMFYVERYFSKLFSLLRPLTYTNGGPIISVQVENEYGSYFACDRDYTSRLVDIMRETLGPDILLFTTDGDSTYFLNCGQTDGAYSTVDFGSGTDVNTAFSSQRTREPHGPLVNSEYYPGWIDHWSNPHSLVSAEQVAKTLDDMLAINASVNIYIFHGGTSFGLTSGANQDGQYYEPNPTSYDFDAPLSEAGDVTNKFMKLRNIIGKYLPLPSDPIPKNSTKISFGPVHLKQVYSLMGVVDKLPLVFSEKPLTFEALGVPQGFVFYETVVDTLLTDPALLNITGIKDRGYVFVDRIFQGVLSRTDSIFTMPVQIRPGQNLSILVENQGRICYGSEINDFKGIVGNVQLGSHVINNWNMYLMPIGVENSILKTSLWNRDGRHYLDRTTVPGVFSGQFTLNSSIQPADTFLNLDGWHKGIAALNGIILGRYWPIVGPQVTLYVPGVFLKPHPQVNKLDIFELEEAPCYTSQAGCNAYFVDTHELNRETPGRDSKTYRDKIKFHRS